nr:MAG TPA: tail protein [Caudoviricetes sp.]
MSSNGKSYDLIGDKMRTTSGNFHKYAWTKNVKKVNGKERLTKFTKESTNYQLTLTLRGGLDERKEMLNDLINSFEQDVISRTPGTICFGEYYTRCFIISSESKISEIRNCWSDCMVEVYCADSFWIKEKKISYPIFTGAGNDNFLEFPYDFPFDYTSQQKGISVLDNDHYADANFNMIIYGPVVDPIVNIGGYPYEVNTTVEANEYLVIDSTKNAVTRILTDETIVNEYNNRSFENSVFRPIPPGNHNVLWSGDFGWDIVLYQERSEPKW